MISVSPPVPRSVSHKRVVLRYVVSAILTLVFLWLAFRGTDVRKLGESLAGAHYGWILLSVVCLMSSNVVRAWRWRFLLEPIKPGIGLRNLFSGVMIGYFLNNVLPRAGELGRPYVMGKLESISKTAAFGTIVIERLMDTVTFLILVLLIPFVYDGPLRESFPWLLEGGAILSAVTAAVLVLLILLMVRRDWTDAMLRLIERLMTPAAAQRVNSLVHSFLDGFLFLKHPRRFLAIGVSSVLIWGLYIVMTYVAFFAFGLEGHLGFGAATVLLAISSIGVAIPTPGSTGSYHVFAAQTLTRLFSVDGAVALSYATVTHAAGYLAATVFGLYFFVRDQITIAAAVARPGEQGAP